MYNLILILMVFVALLLIVSVLLQNSKSDGMQSNLASIGGNKLIGVKKTADGLEKITWILGIALLALALAASMILKNKVKHSLRSLNTEVASSYQDEEETINETNSEADDTFNTNTDSSTVATEAPEESKT